MCVAPVLRALAFLNSCFTGCEIDQGAKRCRDQVPGSVRGPRAVQRRCRCWRQHRRQGFIQAGSATQVGSRQGILHSFSVWQSPRMKYGLGEARPTAGWGVSQADRIWSRQLPAPTTQSTPQDGPRKTPAGPIHPHLQHTQKKLFPLFSPSCCAYLGPSRALLFRQWNRQSVSRVPSLELVAVPSS